MIQDLYRMEKSDYLIPSIFPKRDVLMHWIGESCQWKYPIAAKYVENNDEHWFYLKIPRINLSKVFNGLYQGFF